MLIIMLPAMLIISAFMLAKCFYYAHYYVTLAKWAVAAHKENHNILSRDHTVVSHVTCYM